MLLPVLSGCFSNEIGLPEPKTFSEEIETDRSEEGQVYYSLRDRKEVASNSIYDWDLAFSCKEGDFKILVNSTKKMGVYNTHSKEIDLKFPNEYKYYDWQYDHPSGLDNSGCFGMWGDFTYDNPQSFGDVYIINRGFDLFNLPFQMKKMRIEGFENNAYQITFANVDGDEYYHLNIPKNDSFNYIYVSLEQKGQLLKLEPPKQDWDILFTLISDTSRFSNIYTRADSIRNKTVLVDGVLINPYKHSVAIDTSDRFNDLDFFDAQDLLYHESLNTIGARWYTWDKSNGGYEILPHNNFVVRYDNLFYYLIQFEEFDKPHREESYFRFSIRNL